MVSKLIPGAGSTVTDPDLASFLGLGTAEQQLVFLLDRLQATQTAFNATEPLPVTPVNRVALVPSASVIAGQLSCPIDSNAPLQTLWDSAQTIGANELPLAADPTDTITDPTLMTLLDIATLPGQILYLASVVEAAEMAYNEANPEDPVNSVSVGANFDQRQAALSIVFPLADGGLATLVGGLPY